MSPMSADEPDESRADKAFRAIEGHENGLLDINSWRPIFDFDSTIAARVAANGGLAMVIDLSDPINIGSDNTRLAALWDDEIKAFGPVVVREGSRVIVTIPEVKGTRLSLWCESTVVPTIVETRRLADAPRLQEDLNAANAANAAKTGTLDSFITGYLATTGVVGVVLALAVGAGVYLWLKQAD